MWDCFRPASLLHHICPGSRRGEHVRPRLGAQVEQPGRGAAAADRLPLQVLQQPPLAGYKLGDEQEEGAPLVGGPTEAEDVFQVLPRVRRVADQDVVGGHSRAAGSSHSVEVLVQVMDALKAQAPQMGHAGARAEEGVIQPQRGGRQPGFGS